MCIYIYFSTISLSKCLRFYRTIILNILLLFTHKLWWCRCILSISLCLYGPRHAASAQKMNEYNIQAMRNKHTTCCCTGQKYHPQHGLIFFESMVNATCLISRQSRIIFYITHRHHFWNSNFSGRSFLTEHEIHCKLGPYKVDSKQ